MCWTHRLSAKGRSPTTSGDSHLNYFELSMLVVCVHSRLCGCTHAQVTAHVTM